jgi:hypothetical protein
METRPSLHERVLAKIAEAERLAKLTERARQALIEKAREDERPEHLVVLVEQYTALAEQSSTADRAAVHWTRIAIQTLPDNELDALIEAVNEEEDMDENWREDRLSALVGTRWERWSLAEWMDPGETSEF